MAVRDKLASGEGSHRELHAVANRVETSLQKFDQVFGGIALPADRLVVILAKLLFANIPVVALKLLLRHQLHAEVAGLLASLPVLAGAVVTLADRRFRPAPE